MFPSHNDLVGTGAIVAHMSMDEWAEYTNLSNELVDKSLLLELASSRPSTRSDCESVSLSLYGLSASQSNSESYLRIGDFYYYGHADLLQDKLKASRFYQLAADLRNTHAIFNLGIDLFYLLINYYIIYLNHIFKFN
jgi:TPR repeat protein